MAIVMIWMKWYHSITLASLLQGASKTTVNDF